MAEPAHNTQLLMMADPWVWAYYGNLQLPDAKFSVVGNEHQIGYMQSTARRKCVRKATQFAFTTSEVIDALHGCRYGYYPKGVIYLFPTRNDVADFSSSRFKPILSDNPDLIGRHVTDTDRENLKRIGSSFLFFRSGSLPKKIERQQKTSASLKSIPGDKVVFDEFDEIDPGARQLALKRLEDSDLKREVYLANPTLPDFGIDAIYEKESDRRVWLHKCPGCRSDQVLELTFPECLQRKKDGSVVRVCIKCGHILNPSDGQWITRNPNRSKHMEGYWISHLNKSKTNPAEILNAYERLQQMKAYEVVQFWNLVMGIGYTEAQNRLTVQQVIGLCADYGISSSDPGPCFMGVDQGNYLHVVIGKKAEPKDKIIYVGVHQEWEELNSLMADFNIQRCVVDALPEGRNARTFAKKHWGRVYRNYYNENQKGSYKWDERQLKVECNRTESLDSSHQEIEHVRIQIPRHSDIVQEFAEHMHNVAKKLQEDELTGSRKYIYIRLSGEDHFRHAFNYMCMAKDKGGEVFNFLDLSKCAV